MLLGNEYSKIPRNHGFFCAFDEIGTLMDLGFLVTFLDGNRISIVNTGLEEPELVEKLDFDNDPLTTQCIFRGIFFYF